MKLTSPTFQDNNAIPSLHSYRGGNLSPPLIIKELPNGAKSLCLIVHDPDAPIGDYLHWLVWNIDPQQAEFKQNETPLGSIQGINDFGNKRWDGPAPPSGTHRYIFDIYALNKKLQMDEDISRLQLETAIKPYIIGSAKLVGLYSK